MLPPEIWLLGSIASDAKADGVAAMRETFFEDLLSQVPVGVA